MHRLFTVTLFLVLNITCYSQEQPAGYKETGAPLPALKIYTSDGIRLTEGDLANDATLMLMIFSPLCDHCEDQAILFRDNISLFRKTKLVLIAAPSMRQHLDYFVNNTRIARIPKIIVGTDSNNYTARTFRYEMLPQINIYDKERKLVKVFTGSTPLDSLKVYIQ